ncbi:hypothetical protein OsI_17672 [Oryza sativa Indica Group]|uniref:Uncharacterized protein n=2 Tax=Oryza sativa TaxID=4530 RepID=A2XY88_ORYSI|nr:hypothetical protein OsI_17672 [Oryza sativa Indica Group]CAJ86055.1 H0821G03.6 [Oryza sativa]CAJ86119.1 H0811D08.15 [Oryza sativa]
MWEEARLCEEKGKRRRYARRCSGHRRRQEKDEAAVLVKREHPGRAVAANAARRERFDRMTASDSAAAACHLWSAFDSMTRRKDPLDGLKLYSGDEHYWSGRFDGSTTVTVEYMTGRGGERGEYLGDGALLTVVPSSSSLLLPANVGHSGGDGVVEAKRWSSLVTVTRWWRSERNTVRKGILVIRV